MIEHTHIHTHEEVTSEIESLDNIFVWCDGVKKIKSRQPGTDGVREYCGQYGLPQSQRR